MQPGFDVSVTNSGNYTNLNMRLDMTPGDKMDFVTGVKYLLDRDQIKQAVLRDLAAGEFSSTLIDRVILRRFSSSDGAAFAALSGSLTDLAQICRFVCETLAPNLAKTTDESRHLLAALEGRYVPAGLNCSTRLLPVSATQTLPYRSTAIP